MKKMLGKKDKDANSMKKEAKLSAIQEMRDMASEMMGEGIKKKMDMPKKAVTVAADTDEELKKGLEKAEEILDSKPMEDYEEDTEVADVDDEDVTLEDITKMEQELAEMKKKLLAKA
jgi:ribosome-binding protein aMBF1 (putative translation factor)